MEINSRRQQKAYSICGPYMSSILISHGYGWMRKILAAQILTHSTPDMSNTTFFTPIPIPNIFKEALTIPNTNTNFMMSP